jgi:cyclophilin family peptidyl-prolyl cis-trans isomerase
MALDASKTYRATIKTNHGDVSARLYAEESPNAVNNFVFLAREGFYDGVIFHRVIKGFMIQGGDPTGTGMGGPGYKFADELAKARTHLYPAGTLAMANSGANTNGSQFFVMHVDYGLPPQYVVFGKADDGLEVVDAIANLKTSGGDKPVDDVVINTIEITEV